MSAGKGDSPRPVNGDKFRAKYLRIFADRPPKTIGEPAAADCRDDKRTKKAHDFTRFSR